MNTITFETEAANIESAAIALRSLTKEYTKLNRVIVQTEKQLLKFDEINRLVAYADKPASAGRASSGRSSSSKSTSKTGHKKTEQHSLLCLDWFRISNRMKILVKLKFICNPNLFPILINYPTIETRHTFIECAKNKW